jgi:hypothetical protein
LTSNRRLKFGAKFVLRWARQTFEQNWIKVC